MAAATYVHSNTAAALEAAGRDFPGWPLFITGHSMGGASCLLPFLFSRLSPAVSFAVRALSTLTWIAFYSGHPCAAKSVAGCRLFVSSSLLALSAALYTIRTQCDVPTPVFNQVVMVTGTLFEQVVVLLVTPFYAAHLPCWLMFNELSISSVD